MRLTIEHLKALFGQLVSACGGVEAAATVLGISHQRVSQLQVLGNDEKPNLFQINALEDFCDQSIVTGALARLVTNGPKERDTIKEIGDVVIAQAEVLHLERSGADPKVKKAAALRLVKEAEEVVDSYGGDAA